MNLLRLAPTGLPTASPAAVAAPTCRVNPVVRAALYIYVLSIPFEIPGALRLELPTLTGYLFLGATLLNPSACYRRLPAAVFWFAVHLWALAVVALLVGAEHRHLVFKHLVTLTQLLLLLWAAFNLLADQRVVRGVLLSFVVACGARAAIQVLGIAATTQAVWTGGERVTALGQNPNLSAIILSAGLVTVVGLHSSADRRFPRFGALAWVLAGTMGLALIQTGSRGGLLCAAAGLVAFLLTGRTLGLRLRNAVLALVGVGALVYGVSRSSMMRNRLEQATQEHNVAGREEIYAGTLDMIRERPLLGWGAVENQYEIARRIDERRRTKRDAHNLLLELVSTSGVLGALPFLVGLGLCAVGAWRARRGPLGVQPVAMFAAVLAGTITGTWIASKILWLALALALAAGSFWSAAPHGPEGRA